MKPHTLIHALEKYPLVLLRAIAAAHGVETERVGQAALIETLAAHLNHPDTITALLGQLSEGTRAALSLVGAAGGQLPSHRLQRDPLGGELRQMGAGALERYKPWEAPVSATEELYYLGLLYQDFGAVGDYRGQVLFVPNEVLALLPPVDVPPIRFEIVPLEGIPPGVRDGTLNLVPDAFMVLSDLQRRTVHAVNGRFLPAEALHRINERLSIAEPTEALNQERDSQRLALLLHMLRTLDLIETTRDGTIKPKTTRARKWLELPRARRLLTLQRTWADDPTWNDLWRVPALRPEATGWRNDPKRARTALLRYLRELDPDEWYGIGDFVKVMKRVDPDFQRPDGDYKSWYIRHAQTGQLLLGWENWEQVEGALLRYYFAGPLFWLGVVDLGYLAPGERAPFAFKLTVWGAKWLGKPVELPSDPERAPMVIAADGTIHVPEGADDWERLHLERLSAPTEQGTYKLNREQVVALLMEGSDIQRVLRFLEHTTNGFLPEAVQDTLRKWALGVGRITLESVTLLEVDDPKLLRDLQRQPHLAQLFVRVVGPKSVIIPTARQSEIVALLRKAGYLPRVVDEEST
jgi:hypothetical protein